MSFLKASCLAFLKKCKSSVSKIRTASGQYSATLHPNFSSVTKRSKRTISGFSSFIKSLKLASFNLIFFTSICESIKLTDLSDMVAVLEKTIWNLCSSKKEINCIIRFPAAVVDGSGNV